MVVIWTRKQAYGYCRSGCFWLTALQELKTHTPSFKYQLLFSSTKNNGWLLDCVFCRDRTAPMEWLWQKKNPCLEINDCVTGQTLHTVKHSVGCLKGFHLSNSAFFFTRDEQITPFSRQISILGEFQFHFIRLTDSLPLQSYRTCRKDLHLGKLETITGHSECNWLIILLIKSHEH